MIQQEMYDFMNRNPVFFLATTDGRQARVRGMLLFRADEEGIVFHTGTFKELYNQIMANPRVELCFNDFKAGIQLRAFGELEALEDIKVKAEIMAHPSRKFLRDWRDSGDIDFTKLAVFRLKPEGATIWSMDRNFTGKEAITL